MNRSAIAVMCANASGVSTDDSVARIAATESALPASVPPTPPVSTMSAESSARMRAASSAVSP